MNPSLFCCLPVSCPPQSFLGVSPPLRRSVLWGDQMMKHRLQRLLRPQKEERRSRPQPSTVATVGLEEMKSKVRSNLQQLLPPQLWRHFRKTLIWFFHLLNLYLILFNMIIRTCVVAEGLSVNKGLFKWSHEQQAWYDLSDNGSDLRMGNLINTPGFLPSLPLRPCTYNLVKESCVAVYVQTLKEFN